MREARDEEKTRKKTPSQLASRLAQNKNRFRLTCLRKRMLATGVVICVCRTFRSTDSQWNYRSERVDSFNSKLIRKI